MAGILDQGGWAERVAAPTSRVATLPDGVELGAAATLGVAGLTALRALRLGGPPARPAGAGHRVSRDTLERLIRAGRLNRSSRVSNFGLKRYRRFGDRKTYVDLDEAKQVLDWREE